MDATCWSKRLMSASPQADVIEHELNVRFVPKADRAGALDYLVGASKQYGAICPMPLFGRSPPPHDRLTRAAGKVRMDHADSRNRK